MSPTIRLDPPILDLDTVRPTRTPRLANAFAFSLLAIALAIVVALAASHQPWPEPGPLLLLAIPLALCMNRFVLFPNEIGVTADAAVILAAIVAFQHDAHWLGPLVVAVLVGPLDAKHWAERAFVRMAYNSGSTALVACVGLVVFDLIQDAFGASSTAVIAAAVVAAIPYVMAESMLGVVLVSLLAERPRAALRHQLPLNAIAIPLAVVGAVAGLLALDLTWWVAFLVLLPVPVVPELLIVVLPRRLRTSNALAVTTGVVIVALLVLSLVLSNPTTRVLTGLAALVGLVLLENPPTRAVPAPPLAAILVVVPVAAFFDGSPVVSITAAFAIGAGYLAIATHWQRRAWWSLPVIAYTAALSVSVDIAMFCGGMAFGLVLCAMWGPMPWTSRYVGPTAARWEQFPRRPVLVVLAIAATALVLVAPAVEIAVAVVELEVAAAAFAVRLWRFAPRKRAYDIGALIAVATTAVVAVLPLTDAGESVVAVLVGLLSVIVVYVAWPLAVVNPGHVADSEQLDVAHRQ